MVYWQCPVCKGVGHLTPAVSVDEWYRKYAPNVKPGELPLIECPACGIELTVGKRVKIRVLPESLNRQYKVGQEGVIVAIESGDPPKFVVAFRNPKRQALFFRNQLSYVFGQS